MALYPISFGLRKSADAPEKTISLVVQPPSDASSGASGFSEAYLIAQHAINTFNLPYRDIITSKPRVETADPNAIPETPDYEENGWKVFWINKADFHL